MTSGDSDHRPWFGPKRIGFGFRPQTWQGWLIIITSIAVIILILLVLPQIF